MKQTQVTFISTSSLKNNLKVISNKYLLKTTLWLLLNSVLIAFSVIIKLNPELFKILLRWDFFNNGMNFFDPEIDKETVLLFETYLYMAILSSSIASIFLIMVQIKIISKKYIELKYQIISKVGNNYFIFKNILFFNISHNITFIFCFTNAIMFIFSLIYFLFYFILDNLLDKNFKFTKEKLKDKWWLDNQQKSTYLIFIIEIIYFLVKNLLKSKAIDVDFDQILKYFIPASSLALMIAVFTQSLVKNNVKKVLNNMSTAPTKAKDFKIFYKLEKEKVISNFEFIKSVPNIVKNKINEENSNKEDVLLLIEEISNLIELLFKNQKMKKLKENEVSYLFYHIFYEVKLEEELKNISTKIQLSKNLND